MDKLVRELAVTRYGKIYGHVDGHMFKENGATVPQFLDKGFMTAYINGSKVIVADLLFNAFVKLPEGLRVMPLDGDKRNVAVSNATLVPVDKIDDPSYYEVIKADSEIDRLG